MPVSWRLDKDRFRAFQARLEAAHGLRPRPRCGCQYLGQFLELQVVHRAGGEWDRAVSSGAAAHVAGVLDETREGTIHLRLARSLVSPRKPEPDAFVPVASPRDGRER